MSKARLFSPEFVLLLECCRWNFAASVNDRPTPPAAIDWAKLVQLARFHRVQALVWNALPKDSVPPEARPLAADAQLIAANNLAIARECAGLQRNLTDHGLLHLFVKGLTVAALAYRSPMLKMGWDIDLLIDPDDLAAVAELLEGRGYGLRLPARRRDLERWHAGSKESVWSQPNGLHLELHTRLTDNESLIPTVDVSSPIQVVHLSHDLALPTLGPEELFAYLAVHGASSAWFRLKWISDFAALIECRTEIEMGELYRRSQKLGAGRSAGQALLLADRLFGSLESAPRLRAELETEPMTRVLVSGAMRMIGRRPVDPTDEWFGTFGIHWTQFLLLPGLRFKTGELRRQAMGLMRERLI